MRTHHENLSDVNRYIEKHRHLTLKDYEPKFEEYMWLITRFTTVGPQTKILEIGTGTGWFPILCKARRIACKGLEISPQLIEYAKALGGAEGIEPDIELGNLEETDLGSSLYDIILAQSVLEHVEHWEKAIQNIFRALKPGGVFIFSSTNKFSFVSHEYGFPLYGWLPDRWRYRLRVARQGEDIMKLGIDFNQFTYPQLRRVFKQVGFSKIYDRAEVADPDHVSRPWKRCVLTACRRYSLFKELVLHFSDATIFVCIK